MKSFNDTRHQATATDREHDSIGLMAITKNLINQRSVALPKQRIIKRMKKRIRFAD